MLGVVSGFWIVQLQLTCHTEESSFKNYTYKYLYGVFTGVEKPRSVWIASSSNCVNGHWDWSILKDILYVPALQINLLAVGAVARMGYRILKRTVMLWFATLYCSKWCNEVQKISENMAFKWLGHLNVNDIPSKNVQE